MPTRVGLVNDAPASLTNGQLRVDRGYGVRIDALAAHFDHLDVCNPVAMGELPAARYAVRSANVTLVPLPYFGRVVDAFPTLARSWARMWRASRRWDLLHITLPTPLGIFGYLTARARGIPVVLALQGDQEAQYERDRYRGLSQMAARVAVAGFEAATRFMVRGALTIAQGEALRRKYASCSRSRIVNIPWSAIPERMIVERDDTCQGGSIRLLFVGGLLARKGVFALLESLGLLWRARTDITLRYVGAGPAAEGLARAVASAGLSDRVELAGGVYREADLWREFDLADIFVFPTYAEGFPRVIFEAMARGVPVVSTRAGGIPDLVMDGRDALLVPPGMPDRTAAAIMRIVDDPALRRELIRSGRALVRRYTLEGTTRQRAAVMRSLLGVT